MKKKLNTRLAQISKKDAANVAAGMAVKKRYTRPGQAALKEIKKYSIAAVFNHESLRVLTATMLAS